MPRKIPRPTLAEHVELAFRLRHIERVYITFLDRFRFCLYAKEKNRISASISSIGKLKFRLGCAMFSDYPDLPEEWLWLYHDGGEPGNSDTAEQMAFMGMVEKYHAEHGYPAPYPVVGETPDVPPNDRERTVIGRWVEI